jgi:hypothetical protein
MRLKRWGFALLVCATTVLALTASGCGHGSAEVSGTVTYAGQPVTGGSVILYCSDGQIFCGNIAPDGTYSIPNVPHCSAVVTIQAPVRLPTGLRQKQNLPPSVDGPIPPTLEVSADNPSVYIPPRYGMPEESGLSVVVDCKRVTYDIDLKP